MEPVRFTFTPMVLVKNSVGELWQAQYHRVASEKVDLTDKRKETYYLIRVIIYKETFRINSEGFLDNKYMGKNNLRSLFFSCSNKHQQGSSS